MQFHGGKLPFHHLCCAGAPLLFLKGWLEEYPNAISTPTMDTGSFPLHCYLSSSKMINIITSSTMDTELSTTATTTQQTSSSSSSFDPSAAIYLVEQYPAVICRTNRMGCLPLHVAAIHDAPLDVLFYLLREFPESVMRHHGDGQQQPVVLLPIRKWQRIAP